MINITISSLLSSYTNYYSSSYTSSSSTALTVSLDTDDDSAWSYDEVSEYASDYNDATGETLSVGSLFSAYDTDGDDSLSSSEQDAVLDDDALGLTALAESKSSSTDSSSLLSSILSSASSSEAYSYLSSALESNTISAFISASTGVDTDNSSSTTASDAMEYWIGKYYDTYVDGSSDSTVSSLSYLSSSSAVSLLA